MSTHADKTEQHKSTAAANKLPKPQVLSMPAIHALGSPDLKEEQPLQHMANDNPHVNQLKTYQQMADSFSAQQKNKAVQKIATHTTLQAKIDGSGPDNLWVFKTMEFWKTLSEENRLTFSEWLKKDDEYSVADFLREIGSDMSEVEATSIIKMGGVAAESKPPARKEGLMDQIGPNCWIFVLQAVAQSLVGDDNLPMGADFLGQVLMSAPSEKQMAESGFGKGEKKRREQSMRLMFAHIHQFQSVLKQVSKTKRYLSLAYIIHYAEMAEIAESVRFASYIFMSNKIPVNSEISLPQLLEHVGKSVAVAEKLEKLLSTADSSVDSNAEANVLLGGSAQNIGKIKPAEEEGDPTEEEQLEDIRLALQQVTFPAYAGIKARYKFDTKEQKEQAKLGRESHEIDLSMLSIALMKETAHAILLVEWDASNHIFYRDPNYADYKIKLNLRQLANMAGESLMDIRSALKINKLSELTDKSIK